MDLTEFIEKYNEWNPEIYKCFIGPCHSLIIANEEIINWLKEVQGTPKALIALAKIEWFRFNTYGALIYVHDAMKLDPDYIPAYYTKLFIDSSMLSLKELEKMVNSPILKNYKYIVYRELVIKYVEMGNINACAKACIKHIPYEKLITHEYRPTFEDDICYINCKIFISRVLGHRGFTIDTILELFPDNASKKDKHNLYIVYQLCNEIRKLREQIYEMASLPDGPAYLEARKDYESKIENETN